jgi:hypothetical protein
MLRRTALLPLIFFVSVVLIPSLHGAQKVYSTGKFDHVQQKTRDKVDMYLVNTPVTTAVPYFEVSVELEGMDYVAEYTPRHSGEELPDGWKAGENVEGRVEKHHLFLKRPDGTETQFIITKRNPVGKKKSHE